MACGEVRYHDETDGWSWFARPTPGIGLSAPALNRYHYSMWDNARRIDRPSGAWELLGDDVPCATVDGVRFGWCAAPDRCLEIW